MLQVNTPPRRIAEYQEVAGSEIVERLLAEAAALRGLRVLHVNSTPNGGGVSEILRSTAPLLRDLGVACEWHVMEGDPEFFAVTKRIHNSLQGDPHRLTPAEQATWRRWQSHNAAMGAAGRAFVRERYLITRLLADELALYREVLGATRAPGEAVPAGART